MPTLVFQTHRLDAEPFRISFFDTTDTYSMDDFSDAELKKIEDEIDADPNMLEVTFHNPCMQLDKTGYEKLNKNKDEATRLLNILDTDAEITTEDRLLIQDRIPAIIDTQKKIELTKHGRQDNTDSQQKFFDDIESSMIVKLNKKGFSIPESYKTFVEKSGIRLRPIPNSGKREINQGFFQMK